MHKGFSQGIPGKTCELALAYYVFQDRYPIYPGLTPWSMTMAVPWRSHVLEFRVPTLLQWQGMCVIMIKNDLEDFTIHDYKKQNFCYVVRKEN